MIMAPWKKYIIGEWNWKRPFKSIAFIYFALLLFAVSCSNSFIYQPPAAGYTSSTPCIYSVPTPHGQEIGLFYLPAAPNMPTLLWSHGNAEDIGLLKQRFESFHARGYGILAYDYPGYGISEGSPSEKGCYMACETAWKRLTEHYKIEAKNIIIYGQSVGSGPACWLAERQQTGGLMLVSPITSAFRTVTRIPIFPGDQYPNIRRIKKIRTPLLIIHGDQDQVVGQWNGKKLYNLHSGPKQFVAIEGADHNNLFVLAEENILDALDHFRMQIFNPVP